MKINDLFHIWNDSDYFIGSSLSIVEDLSTLSDVQGFEKFYFCEQTHSANVEIIRKEKFFYRNCDGLISFEDLDFAVIIRTADCVPLFFRHDTLCVYGVIHAGRAGTEKGIASNLCKILKSNDIDISRISFIFGPFICGNCYEIDSKNKVFFNLMEENRKQLISNGVIPDKISSMNICTLENSDFYSYRRNGTHKRIFNVILKSKASMT